MKTIKLVFAVLFIAGITSCENDKSLQKYYVENQEDADFLAMDIPTSMFMNSKSLEAEDRSTLESIRKINVLALKKEENPEKFEEEKLKLHKILQDEKYQLLMKYGGSGRKAALYFTGEENAIDEIIVYGYDNEQGLGIARVLGEDMNPEKIMELMKSLDKENINVEGIQSLGKIFGETNHSRDSLNLEADKGEEEKLITAENKSAEG